MQRKWVLLISVALAVVLADQVVKFEVVQALTTRMDGARTFSERLQRMYTAPAEADPRTHLHFSSERYIVVSPDFFRLLYTENPGAAWGLFATLPERVRNPMFHVVVLVAVVLINFSFYRLTGAKNERWAYYGLPLILGGALGNYVDRLTRGFVVNFLDAHWFEKGHWPSFNVADSCICIGVGMLLVDALVRKETKAAAPSKAPASG